MLDDNAIGVPGNKNDGHPRPEEFPVFAIYNGLQKKIEAKVNELIKDLLDDAIKAFGSLPNPHTLALWEGTRELDLHETVHMAGLKPGDKLLLRPSAVRGGNQ